MKLGSILRKIENRQRILPHLEAAIVSGEWPESYTVTIDSAPYYGLTKPDGTKGVGGSGDGYFHPSTHPLMAKRRLWMEFHPIYHKQKITRKNDLQSQMTLAMGTAMHSIVQEQMKMAGILKDENIEFEYVNEEHKCRGRIDAIATIPGEGDIPVEFKALALDTPVITADGWKTMGELTDDDMVYGRDGKPCKIKAHPVLKNRPCFEVVFNNGEKIIADEEHLWTVFDGKKDRIHGVYTKTITTKQLKTLAEQLQFGRCVPVNSPRPLQFDSEYWTAKNKNSGSKAPYYILGNFFGKNINKHKWPKEITIVCYSGSRHEKKVHVELERFGIKHTVKSIEDGLKTLYIVKDVYKFVAKHRLMFNIVPNEILYGNVGVRSDFIRGVLDQGLKVNKNGHTFITVEKKKTTQQLVFMLNSLGFNAKVFKNDHGCFDVYIRGNLSKFLFGKARMEHFGIKSSTQFKGVVAVNPVDSRDVRCISVDNEEGTFLVGKTLVLTHNTQNPYSFAKQDKIKDSWNIQLSMGMDNSGHDNGVLMVFETGWPYRMKEFQVKRDDEVLSEVYQKFDDVRDALELDIMPPPCCAPNTATHKECPFRYVCWE